MRAQDGRQGTQDLTKIKVWKYKREYIYNREDNWRRRESGCHTILGDKSK